MFVVLLRFAHNKADAPQYMEAHNDWIKRGIDDGVFLLVGSLQAKAGGAIIAHGISRADLETRIDTDPFVEHGVVEAEFLETIPGKTDDRLAFLLE